MSKEEKKKATATTTATTAKEKDKGKTETKTKEDNNTKDAKKSEKTPTSAPKAAPTSDKAAKDTAKATTNGKASAKADEKKDKKKVILTYFNGTGRAELSRLILAAAGVDFEDRRIDGDQWRQLQESTPFHQLPILEFEGEMLGQSIAIARFLAKKYNFYGKDEMEQARADAIVDYVSDYNNKWVTVFRASSYEDQVELIGNIFINFLPTFFNNLERFLKANGGEFFSGKKLSIADLAVFQILHAFTDPQDPFFVTLPYVRDRLVILEDYPDLAKHKERVLQDPGIKKWIENRPVGLF